MGLLYRIDGGTYTTGLEAVQFFFGLHPHLEIDFGPTATGRGFALGFSHMPVPVGCNGYMKKGNPLSFVALVVAYSA
jgi:hypothetical protein